MSHILHLDSSPRGDRSISRSLSSEFIQAWKSSHPQDTVAYRDLGHNPLPYVDEPWIAAAYSSPDEHSPQLTEAIKLSNELVDEFLAADRYVFGVPMYNFGIPADFKAYIDQIIRVGRTFAVGDAGYIPLVPPGKKMLVISARGGSYRPGMPTAAFDFHEPYIRAIFGFVGVTDVTFVLADGLMMGDDARANSIATAKAEIHQAVTNW